MDHEEEKQTKLDIPKAIADVEIISVMNKPLFPRPANIANHARFCRCKECADHYGEEL